MLRLEIVALYAGAHGRANALHQFVDAAEKLRHRSDILLVTAHTQHEELEVTLVIHNAGKKPEPTFRSLLFKISDRSGKRENLLHPPANFTFQLLSDVKLRRPDMLMMTKDISADQVQGDLELDNLPEAVIEKIGSLTNRISLMESQQTKKESQLQEAATKISSANKEMNQKRSEIIRLMRAAQVQQEASKKKVLELTRQVEHLQLQIKNNSSDKHASGVPNLQGSVTKLETSLRAHENEKNQLTEKLSHERKRALSMEQKYAALYKDLTSKDKEIKELKAAALKAKKESNEKNQNNQNATTANTVDTTAKQLKDAESREQAFKQEIRKLTFKVDNHEKNVRAIQSEAAEKAKLMDQKLQAAKSKELELMKKIEDLSAALKKASKAA